MSQIYQMNNGLFPPGTVVTKLTPDSGTSPVIPDAANNIDLLGGTLCETVGSLNTITINVDDAVAAQYDCDTGSAVPVANILDVLGGTGCSTTGAADTITIDVDDEVALQYTCDGASIATPVANNLNVFGGNNISTTGAGSTVTVDVTGTTQYAVQVGDATGSLDSLPLGSSGEVLTSNGAGANPTWQAAGITWQVDATAATTMVAANGYIANNGTQTVLTLPATASVGDTFRVTGMNTATGWQIAQNAGQTIHFGAQDTTTGVTGYLESTAIYDAVELVCNVADTDFIVISSIGNITVN